MPTTSRHIATMWLNNTFYVTLNAFVAPGLSFSSPHSPLQLKRLFQTIYWQYWQIQPTCGIWYLEMTTFINNMHSCTISALPYASIYSLEITINSARIWFWYFVVISKIEQYAHPINCVFESKRAKIMRKCMALTENRLIELI